jgi:hypothetical protein
VHRRLRADLGEDNFVFLRDTKVACGDGTDVTFCVAAIIIAVRGMQQALRALTTEMDARGVGHCTATVTINRVSREPTVLYCARGTVFHGVVQMQGCGLDARKYKLSRRHEYGENVLVVEYDGCSQSAFPISTSTYEVSEYLAGRPPAAPAATAAAAVVDDDDDDA